MENQEQCKLCGQSAILQHSHFYPKFILKWMKETGTGYLRGGENINVRQQDGHKGYLLCKKCEDRFSNFETYFAKQIFYPVVSNEMDEFHYDERFVKFVISVLWRMLHHSLLEDDRRNAYFSEKVQALEEEWREYLLERKTMKQFNEIHLLIGVDTFKASPGVDVEIPDLLIQYMARSVDCGITDDEIDYCIGFLKLPRFFFVIPICGFQDTHMFNTKLFAEGGVYKASDARVEDSTVVHLLLNRPRQFEIAIDSMSKNQREKMTAITNERLPFYRDKDLGDIMEYMKQKNQKDETF